MNTTPLPASIGSRGIRFDRAAQLETGRTLRLDVRTKASRSLVWAETRTRYFPTGQWMGVSVDEAGVMILPCTDLEGWIDPATGDVVDPTVGPTHTYATTMTIYDGATQIFQETVGPYSLPTGDEPLSWALLRNLGLAPAAPSNGVQVFDLSDGGDFPPATPDGAWGVDLTPVETSAGAAVTFYRASAGGKVLFTRLVLPKGDPGAPASTDEIATLTEAAQKAARDADTALGKTEEAKDLAVSTVQTAAFLFVQQGDQPVGVLNLADVKTNALIHRRLTGNVTGITLPTTPTAGQMITLVLTQDATGGRTLTTPAAIFTHEGLDPILSTAAGAVDMIGLVYDGLRWWAFVTAQRGA